MWTVHAILGKGTETGAAARKVEDLECERIQRELQAREVVAVFGGGMVLCASAECKEHAHGNGRGVVGLSSRYSDEA